MEKYILCILWNGTLFRYIQEWIAYFEMVTLLNFCHVYFSTIKRKGKEHTSNGDWLQRIGNSRKGF